ncbi:MAG: hypothetical protein AAF467_26465 [Actinomycetota bacterium]
MSTSKRIRRIFAATAAAGAMFAIGLTAGASPAAADCGYGPGFSCAAPPGVYAPGGGYSVNYAARVSGSHPWSTSGGTYSRWWAIGYNR